MPLSSPENFIRPGEPVSGVDHGCEDAGQAVREFEAFYMGDTPRVHPRAQPREACGVDPWNRCRQGCLVSSAERTWGNRLAWKHPEVQALHYALADVMIDSRPGIL